jgi:hypothetical protein
VKSTSSLLAMWVFGGLARRKDSISDFRSAGGGEFWLIFFLGSGG